MSFRLWFPQLDVYDAIRRMAALLSSWNSEPPSPERLHILDFYFANPPLLHHTHMPSHIRREFNKIEISRPDRAFLSYPSAPVLFHKMGPVQTQALSTLVGKDLVDRGCFTSGRVVPSNAGFKIFREELGSLVTESERSVLHFLTHDFSMIGAEDVAELRRSTGLRRVSN